MTDDHDPFGEVTQLLQDRETIPVLDFLESHFRESRQYAELFEVLKTRIRLELDLPILIAEIPDQLDENKQRQLEDRLLNACREVGILLLADGRISQGWRYLQPISDLPEVTAAIESVDVNDENLDEVIDVALYQWAAPEFGFGLLLQKQGTCNAITFFDSHAAFENNSSRIQLAGRLIRHVYDELRASVLHCVDEFDPNSRDSKSAGSLKTIIDNNDWLFDGCGHHLDVTHLAATVRIARNCEEKTDLKMALELCAYGNRLDPQLQYPGEPPFENTYRDHQAFFKALLEIEPRNSIEHFRKMMSSSDKPEISIAAQTVVIDLLARTGQSPAAIDEAIRLDLATESHVEQIALMQLGRSGSDFQKIMNHYKSKGDLLGFSLSGIASVQQ